MGGCGEGTSRDNVAFFKDKNWIANDPGPGFLEKKYSHKH